MKTMILSAIVTFAIQAHAEVNYTNQVVLSTSSTQFNLVSAQYDLVATKTEVRHKPGCHVGGEVAESCDETVVLERQPVVRVDVSYRDRVFATEGNLPQWATVYFKTSDFSAEDIALLKSVYPAWKHPFSRVATKYANSNFKIAVTKISNTIRVVDMKKSKICPVNGESADKLDPHCKEQLVYKNVQSPALLLTVSRK